uniref:Uncharacterized protein n=1 Tax=Setaria digitata TaxID=48799 RepID=A0A915PXR6_9BILA
MRLDNNRTVQPRIRARRCVCISIGCGCYQPSVPVPRQPLPAPSQQPIYRQQPDTSPCLTSCIHGCIQNQYNSCQQSCQNSCGPQLSYQQARSYTSAPYQHEPISNELVSGQESGTCIHMCMPSCEFQCIQRSTPIPAEQQQQQNTPIPVVQNQPPSYYPLQQYEPSLKYHSGNDNAMCIHLCMPSCESQCVERTTPAISSYSGQSEQSGTRNSNNIYYPMPTSSSSSSSSSSSPSSSYQNSVQNNQTSNVIRPQHGGTTTICLPFCMPPCPTQCTENSGQIGTSIGTGTGEAIYGGANQETVPNQTDLSLHEISINLPQSIQQSPNCLRLCEETCMQQCVAQNQPTDQCQPSCRYTCQDSCGQAPTSQQQSEIHEAVTTYPDASSRFKTFLLRSPPYYRHAIFSGPQVTNCLIGLGKVDQCICPAGYATCPSMKRNISQQQCCRKR